METSRFDELRNGICSGQVYMIRYWAAGKGMEDEQRVGQLTGLLVRPLQCSSDSAHESSIQQLLQDKKAS